jgi:hypothetical protein
VLLQEEKIAHSSFPPRWSNVVRDALVFVQEGKLALSNDVIRDVLVLAQVGKLAHASFPPH